MRAPVLNYSNPINRQHPLNRGLVARWEVLPQRTGGLTLWDLCGTNHGVLTNGPTWGGAFGRAGSKGSLTFDASDDRVQLGSQWDVTNGVTHTAWIYNTSLGSNHAIRSNKKTIFATNASARLQWWADSDLSQIADNVFTLSVNTWYHAAVTQVGTTYAFYVNGQPGRTGTTNALDNAAQSATIGSFTTAFLWPGKLDRICDFNRALSAGEILQDYNASRQQYDPTLNWIRRRSRNTAGGGGGGNRRRRAIICGAAA